MGITERFKGQFSDKNMLEDKRNVSVSETEISDTDFAPNCEEWDDVPLNFEPAPQPLATSALPVQNLFLEALEPYLSDLKVTKIVVVNGLVKVYKDDVFSENFTMDFVNMPGVYEGVTQFIHRDFIVSMVAPPVRENICATFEKIRFLSPADLVKQKFVTEKTLDFVAKAVKNRKNVIIVDNVQLFNTIYSNCLADGNVVLFQDLPVIKESEKVTVFNTDTLAAEEFSTLLQVAQSLNPDYLMANLKNEDILSSILTKTQDRNGKIIALNATCANSALFKILNMVMTVERCNEKIAKSKLLNGFHYIVDNSGIYLIAPAKTAIITLKEIV